MSISSAIKERAILGGSTAVATATTVGTVKPGTGLSVDGAGTLNASAATTTTLGGVKQGANNTIDVDGTINVSLSPVATASAVGLVKPGTGLSVAGDGTLNAAGGGSTETYTTLGFGSVTTSATPTAGATASPLSSACTGLIIRNGANLIEYQRNAGGAFYVIRPFEEKFIFGIANANQIGFRRKDYATIRNTQTTSVVYELINTSASYTVSNLSLASSTNATHLFFSNVAGAVVEVTNTGLKDVVMRRCSYISGAVNASAVFVGAISGTTLTVSSMTSGIIEVGMILVGASGNTIAAQGTGTGGTGTYTMSLSQSVSSTYTAQLQTFTLGRNKSMIFSGLNTASQLSIVSWDSTGGASVSAEVFQQTPGLLRRNYQVADLVSPTARQYLSDVSQGDGIAFVTASMFAPFTKYQNKGRTLTMFQTSAETYVDNVLSVASDTSLAAGETYTTNTARVSYGARTAVTSTFSGTSTKAYASSINSPYAIDTTNSDIHLVIKRVDASAATITGCFIDLFSTGSPSAPGADYHTLSIGADLSSGFTRVNGYGACSYSSHLFSLVGAGATLTAITFARIRVAGTAGLIVRPQEVRVVKKASAKASIIFTGDDSHASQVAYGLPMLAPYGYPMVLYPSPANGLGGSGQPSGGIAIDEALGLQRQFGWQIAGQEYSKEVSVDMSIDEWINEQQKNMIQAVAYGFDADGLRDSSYPGGGTYAVTTDEYKAAAKIHRSMRSFNNGMGSNGDGLAPFYFCDTNPPGDPYSIRAFNFDGSYSTVSGQAAGLYGKYKLYVDQAVAAKGIAVFATHTGWGTAEVRAAMALLLPYIKTLEDAGQAEVVTFAQIAKRQAQ